MTAPVMPAGTMHHTARGASSLLTRSAREVAPIEPPATEAATASGLWSETTH